MRSQSLLLEGRNWLLLTAVQLRVDDVSILRQRLAGRWIHMDSGRTYHSLFRPPLNLLQGRACAHEAKGTCAHALRDDVTGELLERRPEDTPQSLEARLSDWRSDTWPLVRHYERCGQLLEVDATQSAEVIVEAIVQRARAHTWK